MVYLTLFATVLMGPTHQGGILSSSSPQRIRPAYAALAGPAGLRSPRRTRQPMPGPPLPACAAPAEAAV